MKYNVDSSVFNSVEYVNSQKSLIIHFNSGYTYEYISVPERLVYELLNSESKGQFFVRNIRNKFKYVRR